MQTKKRTGRLLLLIGALTVVALIFFGVPSFTEKTPIVKLSEPSLAIQADQNTQTDSQTNRQTAERSVTVLIRPNVASSTDPRRQPKRIGGFDPYVLAERSPEDGAWLARNGFPENLEMTSWDIDELTRVSALGDAIAVSKLAHTSLENNSPDWFPWERFAVYQITYLARLRAGYEYGLIGPGAVAEPGKFRVLPRNVTDGLAWDIVAVRMGDRLQFTQLSFSHKDLVGVTIGQLAVAYALADSIMEKMNEIRAARGLPSMTILDRQVF